MEGSKLFMYVSSWAEHGGVPGLGLYTFDQENGRIEFVEKISEKDSFNGSCVDQRKNKLYVNNEVMHFMGAPYCSGRIFVYDLDSATGKAKECMKLVTGCPNPAYVEIDPTGKYLFGAHHSFPMGVAVHTRKEDGTIETTTTYAEADIQVYSLNEEGIPEELVENVNHGDTTKKVEAHPHCAVFSPSGRVIAVVLPIQYRITENLKLHVRVPRSREHLIFRSISPSRELLKYLSTIPKGKSGIRSPAKKYQGVI